MTIKRWKNIALGVAFTLPVISVYIVKRLKAQSKKRSVEDFPELTRIRIPISSLISVSSTEEKPEQTTHSRIVLPEPSLSDLADIDEQYPKNEDKNTYIVSTETQKFHKPDCRWVENIKEENKLIMTSKSELLANGFMPCASCKP